MESNTCWELIVDVLAGLEVRPTPRVRRSSHLCLNGQRRKPGETGSHEGPDILPAMRAWILGLVLAVMSVQSTWATIAAYCQHQADVVTDHIGHHEHQHGAVAGTDVDVTPERDSTILDATLGGVDNDCAYCHLSCAQPLATASPLWLGQAEHAFLVKTPMRYATREPEGLERPKWQGLARSASLEEQHIT